MNDLQKCELEILKEFIRVCEKNNLRYYLCGGTCLGAVRHKGFIPWDDDVDVCMPREDYDKFVELQKDFKDGYFIQTYKSDPNYIYNFAKVRDSNTTFIENFFRTVKMNQGVWIDVLPLDGMAYKMMNPKKLGKKVKKTWLLTWFMYPKCLLRRVHLKTFWKDIPLNIVGVLFMPLNLGHWMNRKVERHLKKIPYEKATMVGAIIGTNPNKEAMDKNIFMEGTHLTFEGIDVVAPKDYDKYLSNLYGNYMQLPPLDKQAGHHHNKGLSLTQNYKDYMKEHKI